MSDPALADSDVRPAGPLNWSAERDTWPHADTSRFVRAGGLLWHVQKMGSGPAILLLHGTGASTHSWRALAPLLARQFTVIALDLPGHGFTEPAPRAGQTLPGMAASVTALVDTLALAPIAIVGHSAGAAIALRCCLDQGLAPQALIGVNAALLPFRGAAGILFPPLAKLLFLNPLTPRLFARSAGNRTRVERLLGGTGSALDAEGIDLYARLFSNAGHVAATLGMMANWDLHRFGRDLPELTIPLLLIVGENDRTIPPAEADRVRENMTTAELARLPALGHLAHEESPGEVSRRIVGFIEASDVRHEDSEHRGE